MTTRQKRSYEDMTSVARDVNAASHVAREPAGEHASQAESDYGDVPSSMTMPSASAHTMLPPQRPASAMLPPSQKPPISGQDHVREPVTEIFSSEDTVSDGDAQGHHSGDDIERHDNHDVSEYDEDPNPSEPQDKIGDFAWRDLEQRYHDKMQECRAKEDKAHAEFARLCDVQTPCLVQIDILTGCSTSAFGPTRSAVVRWIGASSGTFTVEETMVLR